MDFMEQKRAQRGDAGIDLAKMDRLPPHELEAERSVLGCCLLAPTDAIPEALLRLVSKTAPEGAFYDLRHQTLFQRLVKMSEGKVPIDAVTLRQALKEAGELDEVGGVAYLEELRDVCPSAAMVGHYADIVAGKWKLRKFLAAATRAVGKIYDPEQKVCAEELLEEIGAEVIEVLEDASTEAQEPRLMGSYFGAIQDRMESFAQGRKVMQGLSTGFNYLDNMLCGLKGGEYIVIAARPGQGKTSIVLQMAEHVAVELAQPVAVFSMEMTGESLAERVWFGRAGANFQHYRNGFMENGDVPKLLTASLKLAKAPIWIDDGCGMNIQRLTVTARKLKRRHGIKAVFVDYLQLMPAVPGRENDMRARELADISMGLKRLAKELDLPVVVLAQMNRNIEQEDNKNRKPVLSDLKDCGQIEQDADVVGFLYGANLKKAQDEWEDSGQRPAEFAWLDKHELPREEEEKMRKLKLVPMWTPLNWKKHLRRINLLIAKQRNGPTGDCALVYEGARMRFSDAWRPAAEGQE